MKAVLLILVPMVILAVVMTLVFQAGDGTGEPIDSAASSKAQGPAETVRGEPAQADGSDAPGRSGLKGSTPKAAPTEKAPVRTSQPISAEAEAAAEAMDEMVTVSRVRVQRDRSVQLKCARDALGAGQLPAAIAAADAVIAVQPDSVEALSIKAEALVRMDRFREACPVYERAVRAARDDLRLRYNYAVVLSRLRRFGEAVRNYEFILAHDKDHAKATYNLAVILQDEGKLAEASRLWKRICSASPDLASAWFNLGAVALQLNDFATGVDALSRASELEPNRVDTRTNLGVAYQESGRFPEAIAAFQEARKIKPDYLPAVNGIAEVYLRYFEKDPASEEHLECGLRWCEYSEGLKAYQPRLRSLYECALRSRPGNLGAMNGLARVLAATPAQSLRYGAHRAKAAELCRKSLQANPDQPAVANLLKQLAQ